jgi:aspartyl-tRNA(Asn)/glutamyl-tRNA(Gln) amidotransferase subunit A
VPDDALKSKLDLYQPPARKFINATHKGAIIKGADYIIARKRLQELRRNAPALFQGFDLLVMPTWKEPAMKIAQVEKDIAAADASVKIHNIPAFNFLGLPAITVPCGFTRTGLPVGLQIVGPPLSEPKVLGFAHAYEQATEWHLRRPELLA